MSGTTEDWIIDLIEQLIKREYYDTINDILIYTNVNYLLEGPETKDSLNILIGLLIATLPYKNDLIERADFYDRIENGLYKINKFEKIKIKKILEGLM